VGNINPFAIIPVTLMDSEKRRHPVLNLLRCTTVGLLHRFAAKPSTSNQGPDFRKILWRTYEKLDNTAGILRKRKIHGKWCYSGNPL